MPLKLAPAEANAAGRLDHHHVTHVPRARAVASTSFQTGCDYYDAIAMPDPGHRESNIDWTSIATSCARCNMPSYHC